ncbi:MAG: flagellar hook-length control protein FliK [Fimbriimonadaceae bacterium]|nr:flagellar hook-length control protein FliK [Fimbriimonadaceae bacterium]
MKAMNIQSILNLGIPASPDAAVDPSIATGPDFALLLDPALMEGAPPGAPPPAPPGTTVLGSEEANLDQPNAGATPDFFLPIPNPTDSTQNVDIDPESDVTLDASVVRPSEKQEDETLPEEAIAMAVLMVPVQNWMPQTPIVSPPVSEFVSGIQMPLAPVSQPDSSGLKADFLPNAGPQAATEAIASVEVVTTKPQSQGFGLTNELPVANEPKLPAPTIEGLRVAADFIAKQTLVAQPVIALLNPVAISVEPEVITVPVPDEGLPVTEVLTTSDEKFVTRTAAQGTPDGENGATPTVWTSTTNTANRSYPSAPPTAPATSDRTDRTDPADSSTLSPANPGLKSDKVAPQPVFTVSADLQPNATMAAKTIETATPAIQAIVAPVVEPAKPLKTDKGLDDLLAVDDEGQPIEVKKTESKDTVEAKAEPTFEPEANPRQEVTSQRTTEPTKPRADVPIREVSRQILHKLDDMMATRRNGNVTIQLTPEDLGTITLTVKSFGGRVDADIAASNENVRAALQENRQQLSQSFESRGLSLGSLHLSQHGEFSQGQPGQQQQSAREDYERAVNVRLADDPQPARSDAPRWASVNDQSVDYRI